MLVTFAGGEDGVMRMTMTKESTIIDTLAQLTASK
jgi:hypothetical protein